MRRNEEPAAVLGQPEPPPAIPPMQSQSAASPAASPHGRPGSRQPGGLRSPAPGQQQAVDAYGAAVSEAFKTLDQSSLPDVATGDELTVPQKNLETSIGHLASQRASRAKRRCSPC
jgi:hypothetical protein